MKRNRRSPIAIPIVMLGGLMNQTPAHADSAESIQKLCAARWSNNVKAQNVCRESQAASGSELMRRIEHANEGSALFSIAKGCIEKSKVQPPLGIDWAQALACLNDRLAPAPVNDDN